MSVSATLGHVYTECARIWNPIHTDRRVARAAGLPDIILHGTATLALAMSAALRREAPGARARVRRVSARFTGMVMMPSTFTVHGQVLDSAPGGHALAFEVTLPTGRHAIREGRIMLGG